MLCSLQTRKACKVDARWPSGHRESPAATFILASKSSQRYGTWSPWPSITTSTIGRDHLGRWDVTRERTTLREEGSWLQKRNNLSRWRATLRKAKNHRDPYYEPPPTGTDSLQTCGEHLRARARSVVAHSKRPGGLYSHH
jgi:hypothetical protein